MDPNKGATAPPMDYTGGKSFTGQMPPPAYHDIQFPGYPHPGPGYPQPGSGYPQPGPGYPQPGPGYPQPGPGYPQPSQEYPQPGQGYPPPPQGFGAPPPYGVGEYGQPLNSIGQLYPAQTHTVQPTVYVTQVQHAQPVNDYMCYSVFTLMCCCLPLGIAALICSFSAREANHVGNRMAAEQRSKMAMKLNHMALGFGLGFFILLIVSVAVTETV